MGSGSVMDITIYWPVDPDAIRLGKVFGFAARTDKTAKDFVARFDLYWVASVVDGCGYGGSAIGAEGSAEPDTFHRVVQELVVCFGALDLGPPVDIGEMLFALIREVVVK